MKLRIIFGSTREPDRYFIDDKEVTREEYKAASPNRMESVLAKPDGERDMLQSQTPECWPMESLALAVHPDQIPEAMERNKKHGLSGVRYDTESGAAILESRGQRKELSKLEGHFDKSGGYGDA